ncbi:MAG: type II secretion system minor pseudopilin GspK [Ideonella sp.]|nr:type II secretion system minor pseudopilin GspK [Ideonella sp.]MCC7456287.1 type II secretion system minor pseudopilin GspK [Nitrospira sp.]
MRRHRASSSARRSRGAALLIAMVLLTLVATLAAGMVWQQYRAVQVEAAERSRTQATWILNGALDWARLILREDARTKGPTALTEPWATPLAEARLSTFLAADRDHNTDSDLDAFLSGSIVDLQSRYNLRNLVEGNQIAQQEVAALQRLCEAANAPTDTAARIAEGLRAAWAGGADALLPPRTVAQLQWFGIDPAVLERLEAYVVLLPVRTTVNLNTADVEVIAAVSPGLDAGAAQAIVQARQRAAFTTVDAARRLVSSPTLLDPKNVGVASNYLEVRGKLRLDERALEERSIVERRGLEVVPILRERVASVVVDR